MVAVADQVKSGVLISSLLLFGIWPAFEPYQERDSRLDPLGHELLGIATPTNTPSTTTNRRLLRRLKKIDNLPKRDQEALLRTIDAFLAKSAS